MNKRDRVGQVGTRTTGSTAGIIFVVVALFASGVFVILNQSENYVDPPMEQEGAVEIVDLSEQTCADSGGSWEECGSACRGEDTDVCITVCVAYCQCVSDEECPESYSCTDFIDDVGVCEPSI